MGTDLTYKDKDQQHGAVDKTVVGGYFRIIHQDILAYQTAEL